MYNTYESELRVRPDDIDMYNHVHNSKYFDYVLAARYDQMERCYGMGMEKFIARGYGWLVSKVYMEYKRALKMSDYFLVRTGIDSIDEKVCKVRFEIVFKSNGKTCCNGWFEFVMINLKSGKGVPIPEDVVGHYVADETC